jgi:hypothetical protein
MKSELIAESIVGLPIGEVRLTLARSDEGRYSGVASLVRTGQRIAMLTTEPVVNGVAAGTKSQVDATVAGPEVVRELESLLASALRSEPAVGIAAFEPSGAPV